MIHEIFQRKAVYDKIGGGVFSVAISLTLFMHNCTGSGFQTIAQIIVSNVDHLAELQSWTWTHRHPHDRVVILPLGSNNNESSQEEEQLTETGVFVWPETQPIEVFLVFEKGECRMHVNDLNPCFFMVSCNSAKIHNLDPLSRTPGAEKETNKESKYIKVMYHRTGWWDLL